MCNVTLRYQVHISVKASALDLLSAIAALTLVHVCLNATLTLRNRLDHYCAVKFL